MGLRRWRRALVSLSVAIVLMAGVWYSLPRPELIHWQSYSTAYFDRNGELLRMALADDDRYRLLVSLENVSPALQEATLLYEDQYFYQHFGINIPALIRAFWDTYVDSKRRVGASTITMQVARLRFHIHSKTLWGKLQQIFYALQLERHYSKQEILQAYFNLAPYGGNIEGVGSASRIYFHKSSDKLTLPEALVLAVLPQNPVKRNPQTTAGYHAMNTARQRLFERWQALHDDASAAHWLSMPLAIHTARDLPFAAPHFITTLQIDKPHLKGEVGTTLDSGHQRLLESWVTAYVDQNRRKGIHNVAALLLNHKTMGVEAWVGSANFYNADIFGQVDGVVAKRSPGSALKPFVYGLAMDQGLIHPMSLLKDAPKRFAGYTPENFDRAFMGPVTATDALTTSRNVPAVYLQAQLHPPNFYHFLQKAGVKGLKEQAHYGLSLALGGMETTMVEMVQLYAMLANGGQEYPIRRLSRSQHSHQYGSDQAVNLLSPEAAFLTLDMLRHNPAPDELAVPAMLAKRSKVAWKTGTSFAFRDAWSVGVAGPYVLAIWVGNFNGEGNPNFIGSKAAGPLLFSILRDLDARQHWQKPQVPRGLNVSKVDICAPTGDLPGRYCPQTIKSWFIPGISPIKVSTIHRAVPIDKKTAKRACWHDPKKTRLEVFEFWPSDITRIFQLAGVQRRSPPAMQKNCRWQDKSVAAIAPRIQSPSHKVTYSLRSHQQGRETIPLKAVFDADVKQSYWFVDDHFVGVSKPQDVLLWSARPGDFKVKVVDDKGLVDEVLLSVQMVQ